MNDEFGHQAGDVCLQQVAQRIITSSRWPSDKVARYGGEEFCLVLPETDAEGAAVVAERIRAAVAEVPVSTDAGTLQLTVSLGTFSAVPGDQCSLEQMVHGADMALYASKENGRNRVTSSGQSDWRNVESLPVHKRT